MIVKDTNITMLIFYERNDLAACCRFVFDANASLVYPFYMTVRFLGWTEEMVEWMTENGFEISCQDKAMVPNGTINSKFYFELRFPTEISYMLFNMRWMA